MGLLEGDRPHLVALSGRRLYLLLFAFAATRAIGAWLGGRPDLYRWGGTLPAGDIDLYRVAATQILAGEIPYSEVVFDYPPLALVFVLLPGLVGTTDAVYRAAFVAQAVLFDAAALSLVIGLARRWESPLGPWLWVVGPLLLGPITWMRLDLMASTITIGGIYLATRGSPLRAAAALGLGAATKLYPAGLVPVLAARGPRPWGVVVVAAGAIAAAIAPFALRIGDVTRSVLGLHSARGLHIESLWGSFLFLGYEPGRGLRSSAGSLDFTGSAATLLEGVALVCLAAVAAAGVWAARRTRGEARALPSLTFAIGVLVIAVAPVLSPQFVLWTLALAAVAACVRDSPVERQCMLLLPVAFLTQAVFPFFYDVLIEGEIFPRYLLLGRNLLLLGIGATAFVAVARTQTGSVDR